MTALSDIEQRWLDYAWGLVNCPEGHRRACEAAGGARPRAGAVDGNELRWPGYLGRNYAGILCVGHINREMTPEAEARMAIPVRRRYAEQILQSRRWIAEGRSPDSDRAYLEVVRTTHEAVVPLWPQWRDFAKVIEGQLQLDVTHIAWGNLAKCRQAIGGSPDALTRCASETFLSET